MISPRDLLDCVIRPKLDSLNIVDKGQWSISAEQLMLGTAITESTFGGNTMLRQVQGPALGIYQVEVATHESVWRDWLRYRNDLRFIVRGMSCQDPGALVWHLKYATAIARQVYRRSPYSLPEAGNAKAMGRTWKRDYNTILGKGYSDVFAINFREHVAPLYN